MIKNIFILSIRFIRQYTIAVIFRWFQRSRIIADIKYRVVSRILTIVPKWEKGYRIQGNSLLAMQRFAEGIKLWEKALRCTSEDCYPELYNWSVTFLHRGHPDAMIDILKTGIQAQERYASEHQLDTLGIRFLREWTYAIGHMALLDIYVKMGLLGMRHDAKPVILDTKPANRHYLKYWQRYIPDVITDEKSVKLLTPLAVRLEDHLHVVSFNDDRKLYHGTAATEVRKRWESENRKPLLELTEEDAVRGWDALRKFGITGDCWFAGLHVRATENRNARDSDINSYMKAIRSITDRGGWVIRMGNPSMPKMPTMPHVIDYAHSEIRCDWMDVFLWASCRFFVGTRSGPAYVPPTFGKPCVLANSFPVAMPFPYDNIEIPKLYWSVKDKRYLDFQEAFLSRVGLTEDPAYLASLGIQPVDNTEDEINDVVIEMMDRVEGSLHYSDNDRMLNERFKQLKPDIQNEFIMDSGRIGRAFLEKYQNLLRDTA